MNKFILPLLVASAIATPAIAAPTITFSTNTAIPGYTTAQVFENFERPQAAGGSPFVATIAKSVPGTSATVSETGTNALVFSGSVPGIASQVGSASNQYLAVQGGGTFTVNFSSPVQFFSFIIGSIDTYNNLKLVLSDGTTVNGPAGLSGAAIINQTIQFNSTGNSSVAGRVNYDFGGGAGLVSAIFSSSQDAFEIDDLVAAVPEASTWALMMVGLGVAGSALRRRKTKITVSYAAA